MNWLDQGQIRQWGLEEGRVKIEIQVFNVGNDLCVIISGGDKPHVGAVAVAQVRPSLQVTDQVSASTSVITLLGHKEDELVRKVAQILASNVGKNVVVCCGIHIDCITAAEIKTVNGLVRKFAADFTTGVKG